MALSVLAHGGVAGAVLEAAGLLVALGAISFLVWRSTKGKIDEYDGTRERLPVDPKRGDLRAQPDERK